MDQTIYADVIGNISINNGMVRMDLYTEAVPGTPETGEGGTGYAFSRRLVMPLVGFTQSYPLMHDLIKKMEEAGAIRVTPKTPAP